MPCARHEMLALRPQVRLIPHSALSFLFALCFDGAALVTSSPASVLLAYPAGRADPAGPAANSPSSATPSLVATARNSADEPSSHAVAGQSHTANASEGSYFSVTYSLIAAVCAQ